ncbi:unnamed protein product [Rotaria sp. Silwood1]|nr:unnamed protein product [Rotaria sp. Silwood1]
MWRAQENIEDIFAEFHDDFNVDEETSIQFNKRHRQFVKEYDDDLFDLEECLQLDQNLVGVTDNEQEKQQYLSIKLSDLAASQKEYESSAQWNATNRAKTENITSTQMIPKYLSYESKEFDQMILDLRRHTGTSIYTEELRAIAFLIDQLQRIELQKRLYTTYLRSGQGTLVENKEPSLLLWPSDLKLRMIAENETKATHPNEIYHDECIKYTEKILDKYRIQTDDHQNQLEEKKKHLRNRWTSRIEEVIMKFVQEYAIALYRIPIEREIIRIEYDMFDRLCELEFCSQNPNLYQKQLFESLTEKKFVMEKSKLELALLKQRVTLHHLPKSFDKLEISKPTSIDTIMDTQTVSLLKSRCDKILQRTKTDLIQVYIDAAQIRADQSRFQFNDAMNKLKENVSTHPSYKILTKDMFDIMIKRFNNITDVDRFDDIFHKYGDDMDEDEDKNIDFDNLQQRIIEEEDEYNNNDGIEDIIPVGEVLDNASTVIVVDLTAEEDALSQKLSQLSASNEAKITTHQEQSNESKSRKRPVLTPTTTSQAVQTIKKLKTSDDKEQSNCTLPRYLSSANEDFEKNMANVLRNIPHSSITMEDLRHIAHLIHNIEVAEHDKSLWTAFLLSGTGKMTKQESSKSSKQITTATTSSEFNLTSKVFFWPEQVKSKMKSDDHNACLKYVEEVLKKYDQQIVNYQAQLKQIKERFINIFTSEMEEVVIKFVLRYGVSLHKIIIENEIATVEHNYKDHLIQLEFYNEQPNNYQKEVFENLRTARHDKEMAKLEVAILKQSVIHNHLPKSFQSLDIPTSISLNTINDPRIRQRLYEKCQKILQKTKSDMMLVYIAAAETKMNETQEKFNKLLVDMQDRQHSGPDNKRLTKNMISIMEKRFKNINEHIIHLYKVKLHYFDVAPMVKN